MKYYSQSLEFSSYPDRKDYWGVSYNEIRLILDELCQFIMSDGLDASFTKKQLRVISPYHCAMGANKNTVIVAISNSMALRGNTILSTFAKDQDISDDQLKLSLGEMTMNQIGYSNNIFTSFPKDFFLNPYLKSILNKAGDSLSFVDAFNKLVKETNQESEESQQILGDLMSQGQSTIEIETATKRLEKISNTQTGISEIINIIRKAAAEFIKNVKQEEHKMEFNPIFKARDLVVDDTLIFVALPFSKDRLEILDDVVKPALERDENMSVLRSGNMFDANLDIMENIWTYLNKARIVIVDISEKNPNVFYELGICNTIGKPVITICDEESYHKDYFDKLPFDIIGKNVIFYRNHGNGMQELVDSLEKTIDSVIKGSPVIDSSLKS
ncbi:hypothetical protein ACFP1L_10710 [Lactiplantibacillus nangangensis]|uniref:Uncharacterized protein n=1 Tax=Lactiplantibacillus nangangensis TaxID=2559917 RepID=A0ABW1SM11_9LACO|nr:hypothetical protein [Lactiplantibacillus nangangensis]